MIPKGKSMDNLTQEHIVTLISHVNSYTRKKLNDQSPYDAFSSRYGFKLIYALGIIKIHPNDVILKPSLLKKNFKAIIRVFYLNNRGLS